MIGRMAAAAMLLGMLAAGSVGAQLLLDPTPPAAIHRGACAALEPTPAFPLGQLQVRPFVGAGADLPAAGVGEAVTPVAPSDDVVGLLPPSVLRSTATIDAGVDALFAAPHAVVVARGDGDETPIACGDLATPDDRGRGDREIVIGLRPESGSDFYGYAVFERGPASDRVLGDATTDVTVYLFSGLNTRGDERPRPATPVPSRDRHGGRDGRGRPRRKGTPWTYND